MQVLSTKLVTMTEDRLNGELPTIVLQPRAQQSQAPTLPLLIDALNND